MRRFVVWLALALSLSLASGVARAQSTEGFALNRYEPTPAGDRFFAIPGADPAGHALFRAWLVGDYGYQPLVLYEANGEDQVGDIVQNQLYLHLGMSIALWDRLSLSLNMPFALVSEGQSPESGSVAIESPSGAALGDLRFGARVRLLGEARGPLQLALGASLWLPTGDKASFSGDGSVRGLPDLVLSGETKHIAYAVHSGIVLRKQQQFIDGEVGNEVVAGAAIAVLLLDRKLQIGPEIYGQTTLENGFDENNTNAEAILGAKLRFGPFVAGLGAGPGLGKGLGTPTVRALASFAYAPEPEPPAPPPDRDGDGVLDAVDACPDTAGIRSDNKELNGCPDSDKDGIFDKVDACPEVKGVENEDPKKNGCPPDVDGDGVLDKDDACPEVKGVKSDDPEKNGCPPDRDGDGIIDDEDACPDLKGVKSDDPKENGCPPDTDGDGIRDDADACPTEKGKADPDPQKNGCPTLVRVTEKEIVILQQVQFKTGSDVILKASDDLLDQVSAVLREHPEITLIEIQGHTDNRGGAAFNKKLSERRAKSVRKWIIERGQVDGERLEAKGYGMDKPLAENTTEEGRQLNRRVQFAIVNVKRKALE